MKELLNAIKKLQKGKVKRLVKKRIGEFQHNGKRSSNFLGCSKMNYPAVVDKRDSAGINNSGGERGIRTLGTL